MSGYEMHLVSTLEYSIEHSRLIQTTQHDTHPDYDNLQHPTKHNIINIGRFTTTHKLNDKIVRKLPTDKSNPTNVQALDIESRIYHHLGEHRHIARCLRCCEEYIDLRYEPHGNLQTFLRREEGTGKVNDGFRYGVARQAIEAVAFIHQKDVIHSDLSARQFLVDEKENIRLSDFGGSSLHGSDAMVIEGATHYMPRGEGEPNSVRSDIFALGSTLYEILVGKMPFEEKADNEIRKLYSESVFPLDEIGHEGWKEAVRKCWMGECKSADDVLRGVSKHHHMITKELSKIKHALEG